MSYAYDGGVSTPGYAGLIEVAGTSPLIRLNSSLVTDTEPAGGTFKLDSNPLADGPPVRLPTSSLPSDHGASIGSALLDGWSFVIPGWLWVPTGPDDVPAAQEQLKAAFTAPNGLVTLVTNMRGWANRRQIAAQLNGPVSFSPKYGRLLVAARDFRIPMFAPDPILYNADSQHTVTLTAGAPTAALANNGTVDVPFTVAITGPITDATLTRSDGKTLAFVGTTIGSGVTYTVSTFPYPGPSATDNSSNNVYAKISAALARTVKVGSHDWTLSGSATSGATQAVFTYRDGYA